MDCPNLYSSEFSGIQLMKIFLNSTYNKRLELLFTSHYQMFSLTFGLWNA